MKINRKNLRRYIQLSLIKEITDLSTQETNFKTTKYEQCPQIVVPPIFRELYLDKVYGETPSQMRTNLQRRYSELTQDKQAAVRFATVFSDENIAAVMGLVNDFMNIAGVPAMFCKFLQMAIDQAAQMLDVLGVLSEEEDDSDLGDISGIYRNAVRDAFNASCDINFGADVTLQPPGGGSTGIASFSQVDIDAKLKIVSDKTHISSQAYRTSFIACFPNTFIALIEGIVLRSSTPPVYAFNPEPVIPDPTLPAGPTNRGNIAARQAASRELYDSYAKDILVWSQIFQDLDNNIVIATSQNIDDQPLTMVQIHDTMLAQLDASMQAASGTENFTDANFRSYIADFSQQLNSNARLLELEEKMQQLGNRQRNIQNLRFKDLFISVLKGFVTAQQNYMLFDLPRYHKDISKLGKEDFYGEDTIKQAILQIYTSTQN